MTGKPSSTPGADLSHVSSSPPLSNISPTEVLSVSSSVSKMEHHLRTGLGDIPVIEAQGFIGRTIDTAETYENKLMDYIEALERKLDEANVLLKEIQRIKGRRK